MTFVSDLQPTAVWAYFDQILTIPRGSKKEDAIREGKLGVELSPVSKDALLGPYRVEDLAYIHVLVREYDAALDQIEYLLSIPCEQLSVPKLRLDPRWDPLRDHPRYQELLQRYGSEP